MAGNTKIKGKDKKRWWQIGIGGSEIDGVSIVNVYETEYGIKRTLISYVKSDRENDHDAWEHGTEKISEIESRNNGTSFYACGNYSTYHIDYQAYPVPEQVTSNTVPKNKEEKEIWA